MIRANATIRVKATSCFPGRLVINLNNVATPLSVASGSEACSSSMPVPHEFFYHTGIFRIRGNDSNCSVERKSVQALEIRVSFPDTKRWFGRGRIRRLASEPGLGLTLYFTPLKEPSFRQTRYQDFRRPARIERRKI